MTGWWANPKPVRNCGKGEWETGMISEERVRETFAELVSIDSPSFSEKKMKDHLVSLFGELGIMLEEDDSAPATGSDAGNLYGYAEGGEGAPPVLLSVHMDTVSPGIGKKAIFMPDGTIVSDGKTVLGADDMSGATAIYEAMRFLKSNGLKHRDAEFLFTTGEERYCQGANAFDYRKVRSRSAVVLDLSGNVGCAAYAAPTILSFEAEICGKAAHAGFCPEDGIHAVSACCEAVSRLPQGHIDTGTTANIGVIRGGEGINIVPAKCAVEGEIRSLSHEKAEKLAEEYREVFLESAETRGARLTWRQQVHIRAYETDRNHEIVREYERACEEAGITPSWSKTFGGSDNNVFAQHGIQGIVIAASMNRVHSCEEYANVKEIAKAAELVVRLLRNPASCQR